MRKGIACLLALMLLLSPLSGLAEARQWTISLDNVSIDEFLSMIPSEELEELEELDESIKATLDASNALFNSVSMRVTFQKGAARMELLMRGETLMDVTLTMDETGFALSSSVIPGVKLTLRPDRAQVRQMAAAIDRVDWQAIGERLTECFDQWLAGCAPAVTETGSFAGDAYEDGVKRTIYRFDDRDIAVLLSAAEGALTEDAAVREISDLMGDSLAAMLAEARQSNRTAGLNNEDHYQLALVEREDGTLCGASLTVHTGDEQVSTLSAGFAANSARFVWGYGIGGVNYYADLDIAAPEWTQTAWKLEYTARVFEDTSLDGYQAASQSKPVWSLAQKLDATSDGNETVMDMAMTLEERDFPRQRYEIHGESCESPFRERTTITTYIEDVRYLTETIEGEAVEPFDPAQDGLREISLLPEISAQDQAVLDEVFQEGLSALAVQMFKLVPPEALTMLLMQGIGVPVQSE